MRVIAGTARSLPLKAPEGLATRPTTDRIKETLFNMLQTRIGGSVFVDLFAGSGGIGIEALSRGALKCYFVENDAKAMKCVQDNAAFTRMTDKSIFLKADVFGALHQISEKEADIIFMDPPYGMDYERRVLEVLAGMNYVTENTLIIAEAALDTDFSYAEECGFVIIKQKCYKTNQHVFFMKK
ncbi:MAG: 16S rRNA (guanine(966)-N(2))-methyltransferase RsmD [Clostridiales bacterium]|nr:16S rRNA (guanine(966)-N(2))-methyltransferase RsmD [Clostridiales bacterium]